MPTNKDLEIIISALRGSTASKYRGYPVDHIAELTGIGKRTVYRILNLQEAKDKGILLSDRPTWPKGYYLDIQINLSSIRFEYGITATTPSAISGSGSGSGVYSGAYPDFEKDVVIAFHKGLARGEGSGPYLKAVEVEITKEDWKRNIEKFLESGSPNSYEYLLLLCAKGIILFEEGYRMALEKQAQDMRDNIARGVES